MATHHVKCPTCGFRLEVDSAVRGQIVCPHCQSGFALPPKATSSRITDPLIGQTLGEFEIVGLLGRGGMGAVYKARQASLDRFVAIKVLPQHLSADASFAERFRREARAAAAVNHRNIIRIHAVGEDRGWQYIAMELIDGESLGELLIREGRLPPDRALDLMKQAAAALAEAHACGIVHRDIKPGNILLDADGRAKVADFGLAKRPDTDVSVTQTGQSLGTPLYMPPEAARGHERDARSDLYSLGATFYQALAGCLPFNGATPAELVVKHLETDAPRLQEVAPDTPPDLCRIVHRLLAKDPAHRYASAAELLKALDQVGTHAEPFPSAFPSAAPGRGLPSVAQRMEAARRHRKRLVLAGAIAGPGILLVVILALVLGRGGEHAEGPPPGSEPPTPDQQTAQAERDAQTVLRNAQTCAGRGDWAGAQSGLARLESEYGQTQFCATNRAAIEALQTEVATALRPKAPPWEADWNEADAKARACLKDQRFGEAIAAYEAVAARFDDAVLKEQVREAVNAVHNEAGAAFGALERRAKQLLAEKKLAEARAALQPAIQRFGIPAQTDRAKQLLAEIESRAKDAVVWAKWDAVKTRVGQLIAQGDYQTATTELEAAKGFQLDRIADLIAEQAGAIEQARRAAVQKVRDAYARQSDEVWALLGQRNYGEAEKRIASLKAKGGWELVADHLKADDEATSLLKEFWKAVEAGVAGRKGRMLAVAGVGGTVVSVEGGVVTIRTPQGKLEERPVRALGTPQAVHYFREALAAKAFVPRKGVHPDLCVGVFLLAEAAEPDEVRKALAAAGDEPTVAVYRRRLDALDTGAAEAAARAAWGRIQDEAAGKLSAGTAGRVTRMLAEFRKQYGQTAFHGALADQIAALTARIEESLVYTKWPFDAAEAKQRQQTTAAALGMKVEEEMDLGNGVKMTFVLIPAGEFMMGSPPSTSPEKIVQVYGATDAYGVSTAELSEWEFPQHRVRISKSFYLGKFEVTQAQWQAVMGDNPSRFAGQPQNPVEQVGWDLCQAFLRKLGERLGKTCRLPTEAQWEYACRAGTASEFTFGDDPTDLGSYAWYSANAGGSTHPVGRKKPNAWNLYDMAGNVWELCGDWFEPYGKDDQVDPQGPRAGTYRLARGGVWGFDARRCRSATRDRGGARTGQPYFGFRAVLDVEPPAASTSKWPFDAAEAKRRQQTTADALGMKVEEEVDLGNGAKMTFVLIPAGEFLMGSPPTTSPEQIVKVYGATDAYGTSTAVPSQWEFPQHRVRISKPFWLGKFEVTQAQWQAVMGDNPSRFAGQPQNPVENVSWNLCQTFLQKLGAKSGKTFRLPTEAQWEYACRAGTASEFTFGDDATDLGSYAWFSANASGSTHPVGRKKPNAWNLYDMLGNVWEFCGDWLGPYGKDGQVDPQGPRAGTQRVLRGSSWLFDARRCRSATRDVSTPEPAQPWFGLRVVLDVE